MRVNEVNVFWDACDDVPRVCFYRSGEYRRCYTPSQSLLIRLHWVIWAMEGRWRVRPYLGGWLGWVAERLREGGDVDDAGKA